MTGHTTQFSMKPENLQRDKTRQGMNSSERPRILVVEDDINLIDSILDILELNEYDTISASSGLDGLHRLQELDEPPDLIVSDIMMPQMNGYEFFDAVRAEGKWLSIPFIFLTAIDSKSDKQMAKAMGAEDFITKPFDSDELVLAIKAKLDRSVQIRSTLIAQVAEMKQTILRLLNHEFRTPLTYIIAYADLLKHSGEAVDPEQMLQYLGGVSSGADRLRDLVENFIYLVEMETGEAKTAFDLRKQLVHNFEELVDTALKPMRSRLEEREQPLEIDIEPDLPSISGDKEYLTIALARLVDNASKFSDNGSAVGVGVYMTENDQIAMSISDYGRGIPAHELNNIFEPFYQIDRKKHEDQGAGSGLAIVRGIAQLHGAEIDIDTTEGAGSIFTLRFEPIE